MATITRAQRREANATQRHLRQYRARLQHEQRRAQRYLQALEQALVDWGLPETLVAEVEWRRQAHVQRLGNICGLMFPTLFGCRTAYELTQLRVWDKTLPGRVLEARPRQTWLRQLQHRGPDLLATL